MTWDKCKTYKPKISRKNSNREVPRALLEPPGSLLGPLQRRGLLLRAAEKEQAKEEER